jgi:putative ABC transport system permease protein
MAATYWPGEDAVGKRLKRGGRESTNPWMTIVGVVRHVRSRTLETPSRVQLYWPHRQSNLRSMSLVLRTSGDPHSLSTALQRTVLSIAPDQPLYSVATMEDLLADSLARRRFEMLVLAIFAGVALVLSSIGIYGVIAYTVTQRSHEMGIRLALGASRASILGLVMGQSLLMTLAGVVLGLAGSLGLTKLLSSLLFNVDTHDPATFIAVSALLLAVGELASLIPARRATAVDPMAALRYE